MSRLFFVKFKLAAVCMVLMLSFISGCITPAPDRTPGISSGTPSGKTQLLGVHMEEAADSFDIILKGSGPMKYSSFKEDFPLGIKVYLHGTSLAEEYSSPEGLTAGPVSLVKSSLMDDVKDTLLVNIMLRRDSLYEVHEEGRDLRISLYDEGQIHYDDTQSHYDGTQSHYDDTQSHYDGTQSHYDGTQSHYDGTQSHDDDTQSHARGRDHEPDMTSSRADHIFPQPGTEIVSPSAMTHSPSMTQPGTMTASRAGTDIPPGHALLSGIEFHTGQDGETAIVIRTSRQVDYKIEKSMLNNNELRLNLLGTVIPEQHRGQLVTAQFNSAVDRIVPVNRFSDTEPSRIFFQLRERVPYHLLQEGPKITLFMEPPTVILDKARVQETLRQGPVSYPYLSGESIPSTDQGPSIPGVPGADGFSRVVMDLPGSGDFAGEMDDGTGLGRGDGTGRGRGDGTLDPGDTLLDQGFVTKTESFMDDTLFDEDPVYRGEKISLDFYETDIKNVFRILRTVSGDNFAIDKDVTGNVTLALDKPV
ncbi:MAG: hypothetical protein HQK66_08555, partial [Desulfamplus sp.]|nr:hypothetical protein [Desulfamplus sp.]